MKSKNLHIFLFIGMHFISSFSIAQNINVAEENDLKFQSFFFEALKQKAIKNYSKAIENLEKSYEIDSLSVAVQFELSKNNFLLNKHFEAEYFIDKALQNESKNIFLLKHKVEILIAQRFYSDAIKIQKEIIKINPRYSDRLVLLYIQNKEFKKAEHLIVEIENNALSTQRIKGFKRYLANRNKITSNPKNEVKDNSTDNENLDSLKENYNSNMDFQLLIKILDIELSSSLFELLEMDSKNGLELFPAQPNLYRINGLALNKLGKYNDAIDVLTLGIDFAIDNIEMEASFYDQLAISYSGLKQASKALMYKQKAYELRNQN